MKCTVHPENDQIGYCVVCGDLGCDECFSIFEGNYYCRKDFKSVAKSAGREFKSVAQSLLEQKRREEVLNRPDRQRLVVRRKNGEVAYGVCFSLNLASEGFYMDLCDMTGKLQDKRLYVLFEDLKAIYYVKSFSGHFDRNQQYGNVRPEGGNVYVLFKDGELIDGQLYKPYRANAPRFILVPKDTTGNNISVLIEGSAVERVYTPEQYQQKLVEDLQKYVEEHAVNGVSRAEAAGDFHFHQHSYSRALMAYEGAIKETPNNPGLLKKGAVTLYNVAAAHIQRHEYLEALTHLEKAHELDPENTRIHIKLREVQRSVDKIREKHHRRKLMAE